MFDATDQEVARRQHEYEMGIKDTGEAAWDRFYRAASNAVIARNWDEKFTGGARVNQTRGLDGDDRETGYSIDSAFDAFSRGKTVEIYIGEVAKRRVELGL